MAAETLNKSGGRVIELFIPFETQGRKIEAITLKAVCFDHLLRWQRGQFQSSLALLVALSGESEAVIRMLRYPDADRVLEAMMGMLPDSMKNDIAGGVIPKAVGLSDIQGNGVEPPPHYREPPMPDAPAPDDQEPEAPELFSGVTEK